MGSLGIRQWLASRGKKQHDAPSQSRVIRDIVGPTGSLFSGAWQKLEDHGDAYQKSFDRRLPPSLFISDRDRLRANQPMPMAERCIEDWAENDAKSKSTPLADPTTDSS